MPAVRQGAAPSGRDRPVLKAFVNAFALAEIRHPARVWG